MAVRPRTIDDYLDGLGPGERAVLERVRRAIHAAAPNAEECFSYGMPAFRLGGKLVAGFAAGAEHLAYYPMSGTTVSTLRAELVGYETSKGAVRFSIGRALPGTLVRKLVKTRIAELDDSRRPGTPGARRARRGGSSRRS